MLSIGPRLPHRARATRMPFLCTAARPRRAGTPSRLTTPRTARLLQVEATTRGGVAVTSKVQRSGSRRRSHASRCSEPFQRFLGSAGAPHKSANCTSHSTSQSTSSTSRLFGLIHVSRPALREDSVFASSWLHNQASVQVAHKTGCYCSATNPARRCQTHLPRRERGFALTDWQRQDACVFAASTRTAPSWHATAGAIVRADARARTAKRRVRAGTAAIVGGNSVRHEASIVAQRAAAGARAICHRHGRAARSNAQPA